MVIKGHQMYRFCRWSRGNRDGATVTGWCMDDTHEPCIINADVVATEGAED